LPAVTKVAGGDEKRGAVAVADYRDRDQQRAIGAALALNGYTDGGDLLAVAIEVDVGSEDHARLKRGA
jgi:hypothetical protein